jgi:hypothetical protein
MKPGRIHGATRTLDAPEGWDAEINGECDPLEIRDRAGGMVMESAWYPTAEERAAIMSGRPIILTVWGRAHPPVSVNVVEEWPRWRWCPVHLCWEDRQRWIECDDEQHAALKQALRQRADKAGQ